MDKVTNISSSIFKRIYKIFDEMDKTLNRMEMNVKELEEKEEREEREENKIGENKIVGKIYPIRPASA